MTAQIMTPAADIVRLRQEAEEAAARAAVAREALLLAETREREAAVADALGLYDGPVTRRAHALAGDYGDYLSRVWPRERALSELPEAATPKRRALHRLARSRDGGSLKARQIFNLTKCNDDALRLHKPACESSTKQKAW